MQLSLGMLIELKPRVRAARFAVLQLLERAF
jgi:hypothetical protein